MNAKRQRPFLALLALMFAAAATPALAVDPQEQLKDPALEKRARDISAVLRCLVCQNQSIDDSDAPLAKDLRIIVRQQLEKGQTNGEVLDYVVARYGDFVLLKPPFTLNTFLLWAAPVLLIGGGLLLAGQLVRRKPVEPVRAKPLTPEEQAELQALLDGERRS
ncbi:cytochrome c-type biogenesis protein CcmH [Rhodomicrobium vannielii ATCC 17100]|uniref:cytochrome c-type biogenesis protein n=1 Tax=Rhodomicrobium vannielii TaxID=1069 RepID=UPI001918820D|nr:cytochrome c-type biogenesis protein [Rhodomicrobium vannielii]MBJ7534139.1 cytochrome c-type biogenesis protein CcmH [Rhodomicrobium vannielii ATCC 17100]